MEQQEHENNNNNDTYTIRLMLHPVQGAGGSYTNCITQEVFGTLLTSHEC
jgi:hypothetical protein